MMDAVDRYWLVLVRDVHDAFYAQQLIGVAGFERGQPVREGAPLNRPLAAQRKCFDPVEMIMHRRLWRYVRPVGAKQIDRVNVGSRDMENRCDRVELSQRRDQLADLCIFCEIGFGHD